MAYDSLSSLTSFVTQSTDEWEHILRSRHIISLTWWWFVPPHETRISEDMTDHTCCSWPTVHSMQSSKRPFCLHVFLLPSTSPNALPQCPLQQTKTNGIQRTTAAAVIDRDLYRGMSRESDGVVYCRSSPHICPVLLGSTSEQFSWGRDMQVFFFFSHKQMHQAKPSQAADGRQRQMYEKKNVLFRPKLCIWERRVFSKVFKQSGCFAFFGKTVHLLCFAFSLELNHLYPSGTWGKNFSGLSHYG